MEISTKAVKLQVGQTLSRFDQLILVGEMDLLVHGLFECEKYVNCLKELKRKFGPCWNEKELTYIIDDTLSYLKRTKNIKAERF